MVGGTCVVIAAGGPLKSVNTATVRIRQTYSRCIVPMVLMYIHTYTFTVHSYFPADGLIILNWDDKAKLY